MGQTIEGGWHDATDAEWGVVLSANEWILAHDPESPVISARRAVLLLTEHFGAERLKQLVDAQ